MLFLSIGAGGVGLHLVPGCEAMLFWGSMPFSPAHRRQALKRIHRIGQTAPITGKVTVRHLIAHGSVDNAIGVMHGDKDALIQLVQEGDDSGFGGHEDSQWRKAGRIVDAALPVDEFGNFPPMPPHKMDVNTEQPIAGSVYTLLPGVETRGRPQPEAEKRRVAREAAEAAAANPSDLIGGIDDGVDLVTSAGAAPMLPPVGFDFAANVFAGSDAAPPPPAAVAAVQAAAAANPHDVGAAMQAVFDVPNLSPPQRLAALQAAGILL